MARNNAHTRSHNLRTSEQGCAHNPSPAVFSGVAGSLGLASSFDGSLSETGAWPLAICLEKASTLDDYL